MTLYVYKNGSDQPVLIIENVSKYTLNEAVTEDGTIYGPFAEGYEFSSLPDCSETLRADWKDANPCQEQRIEELETLVAELLFGGSSADGGETV